MNKQYSRRNLDFMLKEVLQVAELTKFSYFQDYTPDMFDMVLDTTEEIADKILRNAYVSSDRNQPQLINGQVKVHSAVKDYVKAMGDAGMIAATFAYENGGQQLPTVVNAASEMIRGSANNAFVMFTGLTAGSANLIFSFGSDELKEKYAQRLVTGEWTGSMCLTEPQAGSSLSDVITTAFPQSDGTFKIKGQKVFISAGDHDIADNIIHLVLARIEGAPLGTKGISLFVVPKFRANADGTEFNVDNDVISTGIYHKMGQKATPAMHLTFGDKDNSVGYLVGEANKGLSYMFQMMNEARLGVGMGGTYIASAAYYASLEYAKERPQGRKLNNKNLEEEQTYIINHPDVKRMLLFQKAVVEGSLGLLLECYHWQDMIHGLGKASEEAKPYQLMLDLMTTVAKTYPAEMGIKAVNEGLQVFGGYGYTEDFPLEQMARDVRIMSIYEGTTGIHSLNLLGRGVTLNNGKAPQLLFNEIMKSIELANTFDELKPYAEKLEKELGRLQKVTMHLLSIAAKGDNEAFLADANLYMEFFGITSVAWIWLKQAIVAKQALITQNLEESESSFYESKIHTMKFFYHYELIKNYALATRLTDTTLLTVDSEKHIVFQ
ncbi:acyl-CoA dehydrogenase [Arcicella sp. DC2W]|uniref:Acyl-CoA dehydrogenase n=1 Tax=Arcicella gelida TaxID=2984195 RepID=A0ABU5SAP1_9BACT|nr:acyl-CoA dehydrogenase [Arcicella sp. DC2W]MEA5405539.1 acyl-CoA dehydrogenase [Arcicella sp. DC2W]